MLPRCKWSAPRAGLPVVKWTCICLASRRRRVAGLLELWCVRVRFASESSGAQASSVRDWGRAEMAARGEHVLCGYNVRFWALISSAAAKANSCGVMHRALAACKILAFSLEV